MNHAFRRDALRAISALAALALLAACPLPAGPDDDDDPVTYRTPPCAVDGMVFDLAVSGSTLYLGGNFGLLGDVTGSGMPVSFPSGVKPAGFSLGKVNGIVYAAAPDGSGGWYVGGTFTKVGDETRNGIARINADGSLHAWNPNALDNSGYSASVRAIYVHGSLVYVGGTFWQIGGASRRQVAAIDADGLATAWNPNPNMFVVDGLRAAGGKLYVLGDFTTISGSGRSYMAAYDLDDGSFLSGGAPAVVGRVLDLAFDSTYAYAAGDFTSIGGQSLAYLARFRIDNNTVDATWYPAGGANNNVHAVAVDPASGNILAGGSFSTIGGVSRPYLAALSSADASIVMTGAPVAAGGPVYRLVAANGLIYAGGGFDTMGGETRLRVAAFDPSDGSLSAWNPGASKGAGSIVFALAPTADAVYVGGDVAIIGGKTRKNLAAIDLRTGRPTSWNPGADAPVTTVVVRDGALYALGGFGTLGGAARSYIGAVSLATGAATAFAPEPDLRVNAMTFASDRVYVGGEFGSIGGESRARLAALSLADGSALAWAPTVDDFAPDDPGSVESIAVSGSAVYAAGWFPSIGGTARYCLAALDASTGAVLAWNPGAEAEPDNGLRHVLVSGGAVYAFGYFENAGTTARHSAAAFDATTGALLPWDPDMGTGGNSPWKVAYRDGTFYMAGGFNFVGGEARSAALAAVTTAGVLSPWAPTTTDGWVRCVAVTDTMIFAGGDFTSVDGLERRGVASFSKATGLPF